MTISPPVQAEIVSQPAQLSAAVRAMADSQAIALDTESNSFHHYPEQLCLIQIATRDRAYAIDTIALNGLVPLKEILADDAIMKVIHGADYDVRSLDRHYGFRIRNLYDTSIAARFTGITRFGLADSLKELLGVTIQKSKRLQLLDWGRRPLPSEALDYAITDVSHLLTLQETLSERLRALGRTEWVAEECARLKEVRYTEPDHKTAFLSMKGARDLNERSLAVLQSLFRFRENEARRQHRPPFFILPDVAIVSLADNPTARLQDVPGLGQIALQRYGRGITQAISDGLAGPPFPKPPYTTFEPLSRQQNKRLSRFKTWRASLAATLSLDPSLLWPTASLERLAREPGTFDVEIASNDIRRWQRRQFASSLRSCVESAPR